MLKRAASSNETEEVLEENGVLFWVNRSGIPMDEQTWNRMWEHVSRIHPEGVAMTRKIRNKVSLPQVPVPQPPLNFPPAMDVCERLERIQKYMSELEYNHTGTQFFEIKKNRPVTGLMECAKDMIREALPIKCLEAVILGIFLTNGIAGLERYPISFKSVFSGNVHRHVVLGVYHGGRYGAIGMSRRDDLMYKPLTFKSLSDLVFEFENCYKQYFHNLQQVKVGLPISHDQHSYEMINWKGLTLKMNRQSPKELTKELETHSRNMRAKSWSQNNTTIKSTVSLLDSASVKDGPLSTHDTAPVRLVRSRSVGNELKSSARNQSKPVVNSTARSQSKTTNSGSEYQIRI